MCGSIARILFKQQNRSSSRKYVGMMTTSLIDSPSKTSSQTDPSSVRPRSALLLRLAESLFACGGRARDAVRGSEHCYATPLSNRRFAAVLKSSQRAEFVLLLPQRIVSRSPSERGRALDREKLSLP